MIRHKCASAGFLALLGLLTVSAGHPQQPNKGAVGGLTIVEDGEPPVMIHAIVEDMKRFREANPTAPAGSVVAANTASDVMFHGGTGGIGVEPQPRIYLVLWGSQWNNNDPSGEKDILVDFYKGVGGSSWSNTVTQYCQGVPSGTVSCNGTGTPAGNPTTIFAGVWADNEHRAQEKPHPSHIAAEAVRAAQHFGNHTAASNASVQYVIATATGHNSKGFGTLYCAYHGAISSTAGNVAYTNLPYMTDAGANCGAGFNGLGPSAGITIVAGHEMAETMTDQFTNTGWFDASGAEVGDKCAWISSGPGAVAKISLPTGFFPVQSLWSNASNAGSGGCVLSYP